MNPIRLNPGGSCDSGDTSGVPAAGLKNPAAQPRPLNRRDDFFYEDLTRTNNELANLEREMVRANFELAAAQKKLQLSEQRYLNLSACSPIGILEMDNSGSCIYTNPHWHMITGLTADESLGEGWERALDPRERSSFLEEWSASLRAGLEFKRECRFINASGKQCWADFRSRGIPAGADGVAGTVSTVVDITERKEADAALEKAHTQLLEVSRQAGMAEVAADVLHNVGNVLNSVNISSICLADNLRKSRAGNLSRVVALLREHQVDLGSFLKNDPKGKQLPGYLSQLAAHLEGEQSASLKELAELQSNIDHIKVIVARHQDYAQVSGVAETFQISEVIEEALGTSAREFAGHEIRLDRDFANVPSITCDKPKVLKILMNLVQNALYACQESNLADRQLTLQVARRDNWVTVRLGDNGIGISPENITRIFNHGFTTRKGGHGSGLHNGALAAKQLGGSLTAYSDGPGRGAVFTLELPSDEQKKLHD